MIDFQYVCKENRKKKNGAKKGSKMKNDCVKLKDKGMNEACKLRLLQIDFQLNILRRSEGLAAIEIFLYRQFSWY